MAHVTGLNHVTLAVVDLDLSVEFYRDIPGFVVKAVWPDGAYLEAGTLWLCLSRDSLARSAPHPDYTHIAFWVDPSDVAELASQITARCQIWKSNQSEGDSIYFLDPDGYKLEIHVGSLTSRLAHLQAARSM